MSKIEKKNIPDVFLLWKSDQGQAGWRKSVKISAHPPEGR